MNNSKFVGNFSTKLTENINCVCATSYIFRFFFGIFFSYLLKLDVRKLKAWIVLSKEKFYFYHLFDVAIRVRRFMCDFIQFYFWLERIQSLNGKISQPEKGLWVHLSTEFFFLFLEYKDFDLVWNAKNQDNNCNAM